MSQTHPGDFDKHISGRTTNLPKKTTTNILGVSVDQTRYIVNYDGEVSTKDSQSFSLLHLITFIVITVIMVYLVYKFRNSCKVKKRSVELELLNSRLDSMMKVSNNANKCSQTPEHTIQIEWYDLLVMNEILIARLKVSPWTKLNIKFVTKIFLHT